LSEDSSAPIEEKVQQLYARVLARRASPEELAAGLRFMEGAEAVDGGKEASNVSPGAWAKYAQVLLATNEFMFVD
jgi:hypothetical protein